MEEAEASARARVLEAEATAGVARDKARADQTVLAKEIKKLRGELAALKAVGGWVGRGVCVEGEGGHVVADLVNGWECRCLAG